ncbi:MAG TPA: MAPEG family protein [Rhizomicrobium sp.]|nr:MAPEG family protein [Rhizomicrobium sp.]
MERDMILWPMGALALLTFIVLTLIPVRRFRAAFAGKVTAHDFKLGESANVPPHVSLANRNYMNLLEFPQLFYVICLMLYVTDRVDVTFYQMAWAYVALRGVHSVIHITYNNVMHRLVLFAISNFVLIAMWALFFFEKPY